MHLRVKRLVSFNFGHRSSSHSIANGIILVSQFRSSRICFCIWRKRHFVNGFRVVSYSYVPAYIEPLPKAIAKLTDPPLSLPR